MATNDSDQTTRLAHMITPYSVSVYGSSIGHSNVSESALVALSYDVTYKLYEILKECKTEMNVYRQSALSNIILTNVFQNCGVPPSYGNKVLIPYVSIPNSDMSMLHVSKIDLLAEAVKDVVNVEIEPIPFIRGLYVSPLSNVYGVINLMKSMKNENVKSEPKSESENGPVENPTVSSMYNVVQPVNNMENDYFLVVSQIILHSPESLLKIVLDDLRTNPRLGTVCYSLLNLVVNSIEHFKCVGKLIDRLLRTVDALLDNEYVDPSPSYSVDKAINALCSLILEPKITSNCDGFHYHRRVSGVLMRAFNVWNISVEQWRQLQLRVNEMLISPEKISLKLNYSVILMFYGLGCDVLDVHFWPILGQYLNVVASLDEIISGKRSTLLTIDICHLRSALLLVAGILYRNFWTNDSEVQQSHILADQILCSYFGESISPVRMYAVPRHGSLFATKPSKKSLNDDPVVDVRKNYRKMQLSAFRKKYPTINVPGRPSSHHFTCNEVFETSSLRPRNKSIVFNFIGSNQIRIEQLRTKKPDQRYNVQCKQPTRPFLKYERTTRCIKYCKLKKSCAGDIYLFV